MNRKQIVEHIAHTLHRILPPRAISILYGSEARGEARHDSDIDVLVVIPDEVSKDYTRLRSDISDNLYEIELDSGVLISPLVVLDSVWSSRQTPFTLNVQRDGILL